MKCCLFYREKQYDFTHIYPPQYRFSDALQISLQTELIVFFIQAPFYSIQIVLQVFKAFFTVLPDPIFDIQI